MCSYTHMFLALSTRAPESKNTLTKMSTPNTQILVSK